MEEDKYIWDSFRKNEGSALSDIYNQSVDFLFFYGKKFTIDEDFILDMIQDLFCDLIRYRKKLGETDNIRLYLMKSFRRKLLRGIEIKRRSTELDSNYNLEPEIVFSIEEELISDEEQFQKIKLIRQGLQELSLKQREIIYYKFTLGYDYSQICDVMSITYESARQLVSRAITSLKQYSSENSLMLVLIFRSIKKQIKNI